MRTPGRRPRSRPKSFASKEKAEAYAKANNIKKYTIKELSARKFVIVTE